MSSPYIVVQLTVHGTDRVLESKAGMTFIVDSFGGVSGKVAHVRDYRYPNKFKPYQIWSIQPDGYEIIK